jgi:RNA polymerase sigma-70 factor, ECF subfamily
LDPKLERFKALVAPQLDALYRVARRLCGNRLDAEDLVQDACLSAWQKLPPEAGAAHTDRWLARVLYHRFVDGKRRKRRSPPSLNGADDTTEQLACPGLGPAELTALAERERLLDRAWTQLEPSQKVLLALRAEGFGLQEIESITGVSRAVLRARLHRARLSFARYLEDAERSVQSPTRAGRTR